MSGERFIPAFYEEWLHTALAPSPLLDMMRPDPALVEKNRRRRADERAAADLPQFTIDALIARLRISRQFAEHLIQPYCKCWQDDEGWITCGHAVDLGIEP